MGVVLFLIYLSEVDSHMCYLDYYIIDNNILYKINILKL